jgi:hypothetical protein
MRRVRRPRRYVHSRLLTLLSPAFTYNYKRNAYLLRGIGQHVGPVLRVERRVRREGPPDRIEMRRRTRAA